MAKLEESWREQMEQARDETRRLTLELEGLEKVKCEVAQKLLDTQRERKEAVERLESEKSHLEQTVQRHRDKFTRIMDGWDQMESGGNELLNEEGGNASRRR